MVYISLQCALQCVLGHLERQVRDDAGDSEADQKQVGENEGSGGVDDLLDLFVRPSGLTGLPGEKERHKTVSLDFCSYLFFLISLGVRLRLLSHLLVILSFSSSQSLSFQSMT